MKINLFTNTTDMPPTRGSSRCLQCWIALNKGITRHSRKK